MEKQKQLKWKVAKFEDKPRYGRVPIFFAGEQQIHIMQPYDNKIQGAGPEPKTDKDWYKISRKSGQVVFSIEALPDFIKALQEFADTQIKPQLLFKNKEGKE
jgi:hypothetical protein